MSIFEVRGGRITRKYLMNKSKWDLASLCFEYLSLWEESEESRKRIISRECEEECPTADLTKEARGEGARICREKINEKIDFIKNEIEKSIGMLKVKRSNEKKNYSESNLIYYCDGQIKMAEEILGYFKGIK